MGEVWLCRDEALGVDRAVKFLLAERAGDAALRARFAAEARTLAALGDVPGVVRVHAAGEDPATRRPFFAMDAHLLAPGEVRAVCTRRLGLSAAAAEAVLHAVFAEFESHAESAENAEVPFTLQDALGDEAAGTARQLPERAVLSLAREIAAALARLHGRAPPVVHRDLKPSNLLFAADGRLLLADFGVAKTLDEARTVLTRSGVQPGTQRYAAPELLRGDPATPASDWYALGVVLYRALTSSFPEWGEAFPTRAGLRPFSPLWEPLLRGLLVPDPARRLADRAAFSRRLDALEKALDRPRGDRRRFVLPAAAIVLATAAAWLAVRAGSPSPAATDPAEPTEPASRAENAEAPAPGEVRTVLLPGGVPLDLVWVPPGTFEMGLSEKERAPCETPSGTVPGDDTACEPPRSVTVARGFWLAKTELTEKQWSRIEDGEEGNAPFFRLNRPKILPWELAERTLERINRLDTGFAFRLPTEAEWEWAARGGPLGRGCAWSGSDDPDEVAWTADSWPTDGGSIYSSPSPEVATKRPNELGLFDMSGSVAEWCSVHNGESSGDRVVRGGELLSSAAYCRNGSRFPTTSTDPTIHIGLRVAADALP